MPGGGRTARTLRNYSVHPERDVIWLHTIWGTRRDGQPPP
jgi:hypothetical protein